MSMPNIGLEGLVKLFPLRKLSITGFNDPSYYRILGESVTLAYVKDLLENPESRETMGVAFYHDIQNSLGRVIDTLGEISAKGDDDGRSIVESQIFRTVLNYVDREGIVNVSRIREDSYENLMKKLVSLTPELRFRYQQYKSVVDN